MEFQNDDSGTSRQGSAVREIAENIADLEQGHYFRCYCAPWPAGSFSACSVGSGVGSGLEHCPWQ